MALARRPAGPGRRRRLQESRRLTVRFSTGRRRLHRASRPGQERDEPRRGPPCPGPRENAIHAAAHGASGGLPSGGPATPSARAAGSPPPGRPRSLPVQHVVGDLLAAMRRQAVHHLTAGSAGSSSALVHLEGGEIALALRSPPPPAPCWPTRRCRSRPRPSPLARIAEDRISLRPRSRGRRPGSPPADRSPRRRRCAVPWGRGRRRSPGAAHVVAVAQEGDTRLVHAAAHFLDREQIGERLARMVEVGERVHHRHAGPSGPARPPAPARRCGSPPRPRSRRARAPRRARPRGFPPRSRPATAPPRNLAEAWVMATSKLTLVRRLGL